VAHKRCLCARLGRGRAGDPLTVSELLRNPDHFHRQAVTVSGTISNFRGNRWRRGGPSYTFDLSDGAASVHVISFVKPPCKSGAAIVEGTLAALKGRAEGSYSLLEITAHDVICRAESGPTTK
jgi:hypothetical protein